MYVRRKARLRPSTSDTRCGLFESFDHKVGIVLRFEPRDIQKYRFGSTRHLRTISRSAGVRLHCRKRSLSTECYGVQVIILNYRASVTISLGNNGRQIFSEAVVTTRQPAPLLSLVFESVDVDGDWRSSKPQNG